MDQIKLIKLQLLQYKTHRFSKENIRKMKSQSELIFALKKKYPIFFDIIDNKGIQYKQFLSAFFNCILSGYVEPFSIRIKNKNKTELKVFNKFSSNYNYINILPWNRYNIIKCHYKNNNKIRVNKEQFMQSLIILFPKFIKKYPKILLNLNKILDETENKTISVRHLYNYLVYCGDKLAKDEYKSKTKNKYILSKNKVFNFLKIFTYNQLTSILI
jgi:hypothetical protein